MCRYISKELVVKSLRLGYCSDPTNRCCNTLRHISPSDFWVSKSASSSSYNTRSLSGWPWPQTHIPLIKATVCSAPPSLILSISHFSKLKQMRSLQCRFSAVLVHLFLFNDGLDILIQTPNPIRICLWINGVHRFHRFHRSCSKPAMRSAQCWMASRHSKHQTKFGMIRWLRWPFRIF